jgi:predicted acylesterase/phospholipase RssA
MKTVNLDEFKGKKIAFVCSGGVVKAAAWHLGVAHALEELGFHLKSNKSTRELSTSTRPLEIGTYVGSSAGAMTCIFLAAGFTPQDVIQSTLGYKNSRLKSITYRDMFHVRRHKLHPTKSEYWHPFEEFPVLFRNILKPFSNFSGFFSTEGVRQYLLKNVLGDVDRFEDFAPDLFVVATQLDHSRKVIFSKYNYPSPINDPTSQYYTGTPVSVAAAASMSVPPFFIPYPVKNPLNGEVDYYIDGEIRETLSTHVAEDNGCDVIISSWTHTPYHYHDEIGSLANYGLPSIAIQSIYLMIQKKIVTHRAERAKSLDILTTVNAWMKAEKLPESQRRTLMSILERKMNVNPKVRFIDIAPNHDDYKLFFGNHFTLNPKTAGHAVEAGYKKTMQVLSQLEK